MTADTPTVMTVLGPVPAGDLGATYMHEHVIVDCSFSGDNPLKKLDEEDTLIWEMQDGSQEMPTSDQLPCPWPMVTTTFPLSTA